MFMRPRRLLCLGKLNGGERACALLLLCAVTAIASSAQTLTTLHSFDSTDGANPFAGLVQAIDGNFYGVTHSGGATTANDGTFFRITPSGTLTSLYSFCALTNCTDGALPYDWAGLIQVNGNFYGTTGYGGADNRGTVFKITTKGKLTTLYNFCSETSCKDGAEPEAGLVEGTDGNLYGAATSGGAYGYGAIFKITTGGTLTTIYSFCANSDCPDGSFPAGGLIQATDGNFYGTTQGGGANKDSICDVEGCGTVFKITSSGALTTLYSFCSKTGCTDGQGPNAGLVQGTDGDLYGTAYGGGDNGDGTIFKITTAGKWTLLYTFCPETGCADGQVPNAGLIQATDGNFYGTTLSGGTLGAGTIFKITSTGTLTTLHSFTGTDGEEPYAGLIQGTNGEFYGTTSGGGAHGYGVVFRLSAGLGPFVETRPTSGKVGAAVTILGTDLTGATSVTFNGQAATFTVVSSSEITTNVPTGATTGEVEVKTPGRTFTSNVEFRVP
jgi:uncharacterized repeat protein (TIGR03803 family)